MATSSDILAHLRTGDAIGRLASLAVEVVFARPVGELVDSPSLARSMRDALVALTSSEEVAQRLVDRWEGIHVALEVEGRTLAEMLPKPLAEGIRALVRLPLVPCRDTVIRLLDREPLKRLLRAQLIHTLVDFGRKVASPVAESSFGRGIGGISKAALGQLASRSTSLGRVASAVSSEVERQVEKRATDFADTAVAGVLTGIADQATDAARVEEQAAIRVALLDALLETTGQELGALGRGQRAAQVSAARAALSAWAADPDFARNVERSLDEAIAREASRPLGEVLADYGLRDACAERARGFVARGLSHLVASDGFAEWLGELLA